MNRWMRTILLHLPRRRRRMWRYVSTSRQIAGLVALAVLVVSLYLGWYLTNPSRIRRQAKRSLEDLTGADVDVDRASFSLFEGIQLYGVEVQIRDDLSPDPFFYSPRVVLRHRPWGLIARGRIEPETIVCLEPVVTVEYGPGPGESNARRLLELVSAQNPEGAGLMDQLPKVELRDGLLRTRVRREDGSLVLPYEKAVSCSLVPRPEDVYEITLHAPNGDDQTGPDWVQLMLDVKTGQVRAVTGAGSDRLFRLLPPRYQQWLTRYQLRGDFRASPDPDRPGEDVYLIELDGLSLRLPEAQGGLTLEDLRGALRLAPEGVEFQNITGRIREAGEARFELAGKYNGYDAESPFALSLGMENLHLDALIKQGHDLQPDFAEAMDFVQRRFHPEGPVAIQLDLQRLADGTIRTKGAVLPRGISVVFSKFPAPITDVTGEIGFTEQGPSHVALKARRKGGTVRIDGTFGRREEDGYETFDVIVRGEDLPLDETLRNAMPEEFTDVWDNLQPAGASDVKVMLRDRTPERGLEVDMDLLPDGNTSITPRAFPYTLRNLQGLIEVRGPNVDIKGVTARQDGGELTVTGTVLRINTDRPVMKIQLDGRGVTVTDGLIAAMGEQSREMAGDLGIEGRIANLVGQITQTGDDPVQYHVTATVEDVAFAYREFPYRVENATGRLEFTPEAVVIQNLTGQHKQTPVTVNGRVRLDEIGGFRIDIAARDVILDEEFRDALPANLREVWQSLQPGGQSHMNLRLEESGGASSTDYRLVVDAQRMEIRYEEFPYTFRNVRGRAVVTPGKVVLQDMRAGEGNTSITLSGTILTEGDTRSAQLQVITKGLPIDDAFLEAIPDDIVPLAKHFQPGGTVDASLEELRFVRGSSLDRLTARDPDRLSKTLRTSTDGAVNSASPKWSVRGGMSFKEVSLDIGFGARTLTGSIRGTAGQETDRLEVDATVDLQRVDLGDHEVTDIQAELHKSGRSNLLRVEKLFGKAHDGVMEGEAMLRLTEPLQYRLGVRVENMDIAKLFNAGEPDRDKWANVNGRLEGRLVLEATAGEDPTRQAVGNLQITRANMYKLPVILGLLNVIYLTVPGDSAFNSGIIHYHLKNDMLWMKEIYLTGSSLSVLGSGSLNLESDELELTFLTGPPGEQGKPPSLPRLSELTMDVLKAISSEIVEIHVSGSLKDPKMETVSLKSLVTIIRRLIAPSLQEQ